MKHYLDSGNYSSYIRLLIIAYAFFVIVIVLSGFLLFYLKTGLDPIRVFEYYRGSEETLLLFPGFPDHFISPKTYSGMLKLSLPHFLGYALVIFITSHLSRSLINNQGKFGCLLPYITFISGILEISGGFMVMAGGYLLVYPRIIILLLFTLLIIWQNLILFTALNKANQ